MISIILPIHNQADQLEHLVGDYISALRAFPERSELILVLNGCTDQSGRTSAKLAAVHPSMLILESPQAGWGHAVRLGLARATGDTLCYTNSARTVAQDLVRALRCAAANPDAVVKATRPVRDNWRRRLGSWLYNLESRILFRLPTWDVNGTPKVFPRRFAGLLSLTRDDDLIDLEFGIICKREGYRMIELPLLSTSRLGGRSTTRWRSALKMYRGAYQLWKSGVRASA